MKTLIAASLLLALIVPAHAIEITDEWRDNYNNCEGTDDSSIDVTKACKASRKIARQIYQQGARDYREGLCYRARPYARSPETWIWERGYYGQQRKEHNKRDWSHCHPGSISEEKH